MFNFEKLSVSNQYFYNIPSFMKVYFFTLLQTRTIKSEFMHLHPICPKKERENGHFETWESGRWPGLEFEFQILVVSESG